MDEAGEPAAPLAGGLQVRLCGQSIDHDDSSRAALKTDLTIIEIGVEPFIRHGRDPILSGTCL